MSTALSIKGKTQANDAVTSTINYVNPNATNAQLQSLASAMNDLTTNTIVDVTRIDKQSLTGAVTKLPRNAYLTMSGESTPITSIKSSLISDDTTDPTILDLHYDEQQGMYDWNISLTLNSTNYYYTCNGRISGSPNEGALYILKATADNKAETVKVTIAENEQYQAAELTLTITAN